jgi:serine/threonine protein kinase
VLFTHRDESNDKLKVSILYTLSQLYTFESKVLEKVTLKQKNILFEEERIPVYSPTNPPKVDVSQKYVINPETKQFEKIGPDGRECVKIPETKIKSLISGSIFAKSANVPPVYGVFEGEHAFYIIYQYNGHSLYTLLKFSQKLLENHTAKKKFLFYQLFQFINQCHKRGFAHGRLKPSSILVNDLLWVYVTGYDVLYHPEQTMIPKLIQAPLPQEFHSMFTFTKKLFDLNTCSFQTKNVFYEGEKVVVFRSSGESTFGRIIGPAAKGAWRVMIETENYECAWKDLLPLNIGKIPSELGIDGIQSYIMLWSRGEISNYEYLMVLNTLSGRRQGDWQHPPVVPWVIDFSSPNGKWRDLTKTKYRLSKGDQMLELTYNSHDPHHINEIISEITYFIYRARVTPISDLRAYVRSNFEPREYPGSIQRLYNWSPDECIPEFYSDPSIFKSLHKEMDDLMFPEWAKDPADFITKHREALESDHVSRNLHHWIDLVFGYKLTGDAAVQAMNVALLPSTKKPTRSGFVQLFSDPHPMRLCVRSSTDESPDKVEVSEYHSRRHNTMVESTPKTPREDMRKSSTLFGLFNPQNSLDKKGQNISL